MRRKYNRFCTSHSNNVLVKRVRRGIIGGKFIDNSFQLEFSWPMFTWKRVTKTIHLIYYIETPFYRFQSHYMKLLHFFFSLVVILSIKYFFFGTSFVLYAVFERCLFSSYCFIFGIVFFPLKQKRCTIHARMVMFKN